MHRFQRRSCIHGCSQARRRIRCSGWPTGIPSIRTPYKGDYDQFGTRNDPMVGVRVGGTIKFGGGLALYSQGDVVGGLGLSGDTACADHSTAWRLRANLRLAPGVPNDTVTLNDTSGHPHCPNDGGTQGATP